MKMCKMCKKQFRENCKKDGCEKSCPLFEKIEVETAWYAGREFFVLPSLYPDQKEEKFYLYELKGGEPHLLPHPIFPVIEVKKVISFLKVIISLLEKI